MMPRAASWPIDAARSEEHTSELQSRGLISYAVFCLKKKKRQENSRDTRGLSLDDGRTRGVRESTTPLFTPVAAGAAVRPFKMTHNDLVFFLMMRRPPESPLFPYPALFR